MDLIHLSLDDLNPARVNVRKRGGKAVDNLVPSIRSLGLVQPLLVRRNCDGFEIVAGQRRYHALKTLADEGIEDPVPCIVMAEGDDALAIEASLAENVARLPMDEIDQYKAFAALIRKGLDVDGIATRFGVSERLVTQRLAIANLIAPVLTAYRNDEIDAGTVRMLTMANKEQQKTWLGLLRSDEHYAPTGRMLRHWLFGGATVPVNHARFDVEESGLAITSDLFGEDAYFTDSEAFWPLQSAAVAELADGYRADGWQDVVVHEIGEHWPSWNYAPVAKADGGSVHIVIGADGAVEAHEGVLDHDTLRQRQKADAAEDARPVRPELTKSMQRYLDLHRHAAVRADLLQHPGIALRLAIAQIIAGSDLWAVTAEPQTAPNDAIAESLEVNRAEAAFAEERAEIAALLGIGGEIIVPRRGDWSAVRDIHTIFTALLGLEDDAVSRILTFVAAETLAVGSAMIDVLALEAGTDMARYWSPDDTFFALLRDKAAINAMLGEIGGKAAADANLTATAKVQKGIIRDYLDGTRDGGAEHWQPRYMAFPMTAYTDRGGIAAIENWEAVRDRPA